MESDFVVGDILKSKLSGFFYLFRGYPYFCKDKTLVRLTGLHYKSRVSQSVFPAKDFVKVGHDGI